MSDLYRFNDDAYPGRLDTDFYERMDVLIPVERCEHDRIDGHSTVYDPLKDRNLDGHWCVGAGLDDD